LIAENNYTFMYDVVKPQYTIGIGEYVTVNLLNC
jgi:hypothetical protein